jgi:hypothetical protein
VEAGGVGITRRVENWELIQNATHTKRSGLRNCAQLERNWNTAFMIPPDFLGCLIWSSALYFSAHRLSEWLNEIAECEGRRNLPVAAISTVFSIDYASVGSRYGAQLNLVVFSQSVWYRCRNFEVALMVEGPNLSSQAIDRRLLVIWKHGKVVFFVLAVDSGLHAAVLILQRNPYWFGFHSSALNFIAWALEWAAATAITIFCLEMVAIVGLDAFGGIAQLYAEIRKGPPKT